MRWRQESAKSLGERPSFQTGTGVQAKGYKASNRAQRMRLDDGIKPRDDRRCVGDLKACAIVQPKRGWLESLTLCVVTTNSRLRLLVSSQLLANSKDQQLGLCPTYSLQSLRPRVAAGTLLRVGLAARDVGVIGGVLLRHLGERRLVIWFGIGRETAARSSRVLCTDEVELVGEWRLWVVRRASQFKVGMVVKFVLMGDDDE